MDQPGRGAGRSLMTAMLVSDDQVEIRRAGNRLLAQAPTTIAGKLEVRGVGIVQIPYRKAVELALAVVLTDQRNIERLPEYGALVHEVLGIKLPVVAIDPKLASAPARLRAALAQL
jgi:serine kinase of HPr protein (carbohydrate metabolism regulator)